MKHDEDDPIEPELNPDEGVWAQAKDSLANGRIDTIDELGFQLIDSFEDLKAAKRNLRVCLHQSDLPFF